MRRKKNKIAFLWENFGPMHIDRCTAVAIRNPESEIFGIELFKKSSTYDWKSDNNKNFVKYTLFDNSDHQNVFVRFCKIISTIFRARATDVFLCHYQRPEIFAVAFILRFLGVRVFVMSCSKFDDMPRRAFREVIKRVALAPYQGGLSSGIRPIAYLRFLGIDPKRLVGQYNTLSIERMRAQAGGDPAPEGLNFSERNFVCIARMVEKKNLSMLLDAFAAYRDLAGETARTLTICGSGPLEEALRGQAQSLSIEKEVHFTGFIQSEEVSAQLCSGLALLLPSIEEQFGNVVIEAQAFGLPVILSDNCGARDLLVRSGVNGFVIEPDNPTGMAFFMDLIARDSELWYRMCRAARNSAERGDVARFAEGVEKLVMECG